ncbi:ECF subfamily RNA polymerase sigma-24 factor [Acetobacter senegalensis]|uniref:ECF subfamily RNA polymerase sigma-24 factor n=1 Tax=Acetobacter senegalensis TaxID=446692 RepID=A0A0U5ERI2_9PROT|nr:sigma-70 family RNA polymerase sigma factor [Acetobacter senegalensis]CEF39967.1 ECF subfamily RNA polymerase sigma-24 factor [Acetobacter senegalensis]
MNASRPIPLLRDPFMLVEPPMKRRATPPEETAAKPSSPLPDTDHLAWIAQDVMPHENAVRQWLSRTLLPGVTEDDIIQECYARFCAAPFQDIQNGRAFFFSCARNLVIEYARKSKIRYLDADLGLEACNVADDRPNPEQNLAARQQLDWLREQMMTLPSPCKDVFILRKIYNHSHDYIAQSLGISRRAVERHIGRGLQKLIEASKRSK